MPRDITISDLATVQGSGNLTLLDAVTVLAGGELLAAERVNRGDPAGAEPPVERDHPAWMQIRALAALWADADPEASLRDLLSRDVVDLATAVGASTDELDAPIEETLLRERRPSAALAESWATVVESLSDGDHTILEKRTTAADPLTLEQLGAELGVTRERVRQREKRMLEQLPLQTRQGIVLLSRLVQHRLGEVVTPAEVTRAVNALVAEETLVSAGLRALVRNELDYVEQNNVCLRGEALAAALALDELMETLADDVGLVATHELHQALGSAPNAWAADLTTFAGIIRIGGWYAVRDTKKARAKAAVLDIGRPSTAEEIAEAAGLDDVGNHLSNIPSIVRADKHRWGLDAWVEDVYEGIPAEIIQRIEEDGGATRLDRLLTELPERFGVAEGSVRIYLMTPQFYCRDGWVSVADPASVQLRPLESVITGTDPHGNRYWVFRIEARYFDGYSLVGLPAEIAHFLGCKPNESVRVPLDDPGGFEPLSINWRLASTTGASLGYLSGPLRALGVSEGDLVALVLHSPTEVRLRRHGTAEEPTDEPDDRALSVLERMKQRRRVL